MGLRDDTRGASVALTHSLTLGITALLIASLLIGAGGLLERQQERVATQGLQNVAEGTTNDLKSVDRLASRSHSGEVVSMTSMPTHIAGENYDLALVNRDGNRSALFANMTTPNVVTAVEFRNESRICERTLSSGPLRVVYDPDADCLTIESADR
ncbi:DUF7266 family protein [Halorientalis regularis]|uniref:Uncharacterized protein n=1 Tax=Halorientalis regularis TaxID=660518 RepID=A0A1G7F3C6_9EURY|nr:hypothetical protein [Halorientalis regularis]SDE70391.1 hypothetical protein SAMN05216218_1017 [Halorientalis regularis]